MIQRPQIQSTKESHEDLQAALHTLKQQGFKCDGSAFLGECTSKVNLEGHSEVMDYCTLSSCRNIFSGA